MSTSSQSINSKPRKYYDVSRFYVKRRDDEDVYFECKGCCNMFKCGVKEDGSSTLRCHLENCRMSKRSAKIAKEKLVSAVVQHDLPSSIVEFKGFRTFMKYLSPDIPCFSRKSVVSDVKKLYLKEKAKLKRVLANIIGRVCLTVDVWTASTNKCYLCLAARFVDEDWKLNCKILNFHCLEGTDLAAKVIEFLLEWGIHGKVFSVMSSNTLRNDAMQDILKKQLLLGNNLLCGGEFFRGRCLGDTLNLIVQNGLKLCAGVLFKIRESLKYIKGSESRRKIFADCVSQFSDIDSSVGLRLDVCTRWDSTYLMLYSAIKYKKAFASFRLVDLDYDSDWCPTDEEWNRGEKLREFLKPFYSIYNLICESSSQTSHFFMQVFNIENMFKEKLSSEDAMVRDLWGSMIDEFDKYWNEYTMMLAIGVIFHPLIKLTGLESLYSKVESDSSKCQEKISLVKRALYKLFEDYDGKSPPPLPFPFPGNDFFSADFVEYEREYYSVRHAGKSQLDLYLEAPKPFHLKYGLDIFEYWKYERNQWWPDVALMACDVLTTPITTVASESGFSIGAHMLTKYRYCTVPENVQDLICTRNWLHGFASNGKV
ncbi:hypothetical protein ACS0TY_019238 [Phlomoides rotata]